jgi:putative DNA primase/helicase
MILNPVAAVALSDLLKGQPAAVIIHPNGDCPDWQKALIATVIASSPDSRDRTFKLAISGRADRAAIEADVFKADQLLYGDPNKLHLTDLGNAETIAALHGQHVRFDHMQGRWLIWCGQRWKPDTNGEIARIAITTVRERMKLALTITDREQRTEALKWAMTSESKFRLQAAQDLAAKLHPLADDGTHWDTEPFLLGCPNGVLDLRTGELRPGMPEDRITQQTSVDYDPNARASRWEDFLCQIFSNDTDLIDYIRRCVGYSLTGDIREQCIFFCWGSGANGKSTFLDILRQVLCDYAANTPFSTFDLSRQTSIPNDLAALCRSRLVTASETNESRRLNEGRVKAMTGDSVMTARFMHQEFFSFTPKFKIWLAMNHKPCITGTDDGIWRRIRLIPFTVSFKGREDKTLLEKLRAEQQGIFAWAVRGALDWQGRGLEMPKTVRSATDAYRMESDTIAQFEEEALVINPKAKVVASALYHQYADWCKDTGHEPLNSTNFGRRLLERGYEKQKQSGNIYYIGLGLPELALDFKDS